MRGDEEARTRRRSWPSCRPSAVAVRPDAAATTPTRPRTKPSDRRSSRNSSCPRCRRRRATFSRRSEGPPPGLLVWLGDGKTRAGRSDGRRVATASAAAIGSCCSCPSPATQAAGRPTTWSTSAACCRPPCSRFGVDRATHRHRRRRQGRPTRLRPGFQGRKLVRGVAVIDSPLPRTLELPDEQPQRAAGRPLGRNENTPLSLLIRQDLREAGRRPATRRRRSSAAARRADEATLDAATRGKARPLDRRAGSLLSGSSPTDREAFIG